MGSFGSYVMEVGTIASALSVHAHDRLVDTELDLFCNPVDKAFRYAEVGPFVGSVELVQVWRGIEAHCGERQPVAQVRLRTGTLRWTATLSGGA